MLICPQCNFENPNANKFCQNCGTSLTHHICQECGTEVPLNAQSCYNCGAECGKVWWAIITKEGSGDWDLGSWQDIHDDLPTLPLSSEFAPSPATRPVLKVGSYIDQEQRYQLLEPLPILETNTAQTELGVRVLDAHPYQISPIEAILENQSQGLLSSTDQERGIPGLAKAYIELQAQNQPGTPVIHDAWQEGNTQVVLIEDRSDWPRLLDLWKEETTSSLQILHWFYQMTQLWAVLEPLKCRQSLLELSNLRLDEDQTLVLARLYLEALSGEQSIDLATEARDEDVTLALTKQPLTLKALGEVWQELFRQSQRTQFGSVLQILEDLELGKIQAIAQLRSRLEAIATELETSPIPSFSRTANQYPTAPTIVQPEDDLEDSSAKTDDLPTIVLSMQLSSLEDAGRTDVGRQRQHNEDYFGIETKIDKLDLPRNRAFKARGLYILCDGMGGHAGGEIASELAVSTVRQYFQEYWQSDQRPTEENMREAVYLANQAIYQLNQQDARSGVGRMGTTLVILLIQDTQAAIAHVGDSRLYRLTRKRGLEQITVDHEVGQREIARGVEPSIAYGRPDAYQLTQALGPRDERAINPDIEFFDINEDSLLILASDGLSDNDLLETHWKTHLLPLLSSGSSLERGVSELIDLANQENGHDNITAILVRAKVRPNMDNSGIRG
ncbi:serine/threonine phosphatase [Nostoc sp. FACHB-152]|uniref:serine/threonine phosphatase n=1 Tax=unclassified Nostoc TaxID=2593658 RepID=UPI0016854658|nr:MULTISPECIES: serine/threonine phosphatase [unclassified Nostoc]MBD2447733.1 serine/threonine phosphatase [Nostoc sp. FACHB-152]MBD2467024.1 serine/threonine phosphatase [Nostoc sp. FACHB-145]